MGAETANTMNGMREPPSRREARRRATIRRRRAVALIAGAALLLIAVTAFASRDGEDGGAIATAASEARTTAAEEATTTTAPTAPAVPSRLGSGNPVTFAFGGDIHFEEPIRSYLDGDSSVILRDVAPWFKRADIAMVNVETAITTRGEPAPDKGYNFRAPPSGLAAVKSGGVDVITIANNHGMDFGVTGLKDTLRAARRIKLPLVGAGLNARRAYAPYRTTVDGQRIAILAASQVIDEHLISSWVATNRQPGIATAKETRRLLAAVRAARKTSDTVVVYLHWGYELEPCPTANQKALARDLVRSGADIIVGTHAHIPLGAGRMGGALVAYGLGNFVFYASREDNTRSGVLEVTATGRRIDSYRWRPARIQGGRPVPATGSERRMLLRDWNSLRSCTGLKK